MGAGKRNPLVSGLLAALSLLAGLATALLGVLAAPVALAAVGALVVYRLAASQGAPPFPSPRPSLGWLRELADFVLSFVAWAAPQVPFLAPFIVFVAVTWPLPQESSDSLRFQEQASQIILVLLIAYGIEAGAIRWRSRPVNWILSLMTVAILLTGEVYALIDLATDSPDHADIIAGSMAAGVTAILVTAVLGSTQKPTG
ncbi:MAG TPA: hypothetical protein VFX85_06825 [Solirubrobacterales bacterium]|nr:hypothetical protein [Solirubrobacterales bacterium]